MNNILNKNIINSHITYLQVTTIPSLLLPRICFFISVQKQVPATRNKTMNKNDFIYKLWQIVSHDKDDGDDEEGPYT